MIVKQLARALGNRLDLDGGQTGGHAACLAAAVKGAESTAADNRQGDQQNKRSKERH